jgi:DNA-binding NtrC family response regulator
MTAARTGAGGDPGAPDSAGGTSGHVLLVDDDPEFLYTYAAMLRRVGFGVSTAHDGDEALQLIDADRFDVVVADVGMPRLGGVALLRAVRQRDLDVPVLLVSGARTLETALKGVEYGALRYLAKPLEPATLEDAVRDAVTLRRTSRA